MRTRLHAQVVSYGATNRMSGFTLLELMTVLVIGGILAAISMPYFFSRAVAAKQAEGKMLVGVLNRAQQAYFSQNAKFSDNLDALALDLRSSNYTFAVRTGDGGTLFSSNYATSNLEKVRSYVGMSAVIQDPSGYQSMQSILCEADMPGSVEAAQPTHNGSDVACGSGTRALP